MEFANSIELATSSQHMKRLKLRRENRSAVFGELSACRCGNWRQPTEYSQNNRLFSRLLRLACGSISGGSAPIHSARANGVAGILLKKIGRGVIWSKVQQHSSSGGQLIKAAP